MSFIFKILPENFADLSVDIALILSVVALTALLIEKVSQRKGRRSG